MPVSPGDIVKAVATHDLYDNVVSQTVWYWELDSVGDQTYADVYDACEAKIEAIYDDLKDYIQQNTHLGGLKVNLWEWNVGQAKWETGPLVGVGTLTDGFLGTTNAMPHIVAMILSGFAQDVNTRTRKSFAGVTEDAANDSDVVAGALTDLATALVEWLAPQVIAGADQLLPVIPAKDGTSPYLLYGLVSGLTGSQRQRKPGEGI